MVDSVALCGLKSRKIWTPKLAALRMALVKTPGIVGAVLNAAD